MGSKSIPFRVNLYNTFALLSGWSNFSMILFSSSASNREAKILVAIPSADFKKVTVSTLFCEHQVSDNQQRPLVSPYIKGAANRAI